MPSLLVRWLVMTVAVMITAYLLPGITVQDPLAAFLAAVILSLLNAVVRPILILLTLPINIVTLGLFTLVINGVLLWMTGWLLHGKLSVSGPWTAILGALMISIVSGLLSWMLKSGEKRDGKEH